MRRPPPRTLAITEPHLRPGGELSEWARRLGDAGVDAIQLRVRGATDRQLLDAAQSLRSTPGAPAILINGRADVAVAADLAGVHLPAAGLPVRDVRRLVGHDRWVGRSAHSLEEIDRAAAEGADYAVLGPIYETPSKLRYGPPLGLEPLAAACRRSIRVLAIGGITSERLSEVAATGAYGIAAIRELLDPRRAARIVLAVERSFR